MQKPSLSVVMPVHEGVDWIATTLQSVVAEPPDGLEIIVLDSSPSSNTSEIVESFADRLSIRLERRPDLLPWQVKTNVGVEMAKADHVCMLHQDDLWLPGRVDAVRRWIDTNPDCALHLGSTAMIDRYGRSLGTWRCPLPPEVELTAEFLLERLLVQNFISVPAPVFRRDAWMSCAGMDQSLWYTADWDVWLKLIGVGSVRYHAEVTTAFRVHGSSLTMIGSRNPRDFRAQMETVLVRHIPRLPTHLRVHVERAARASIDVNASLALASGGSLRAIASALRGVLSLGPNGIRRYLRDSRLQERVSSRLRAKLTSGF